MQLAQKSIYQFVASKNEKCRRFKLRLSLTGTFNNGIKFTNANSLMVSGCYPINSANLSTAATEMTFNGNYASDSFKNEDLIDITGTFNGGKANIAADQTIRRKAIVTSSSTIFNKTINWDSYKSYTCNNLGNRLVAKESKKETVLDINVIAIYPNVSHGSFSVYNSNSM